MKPFLFPTNSNIIIIVAFGMHCLERCTVHTVYIVGIWFAILQGVTFIAVLTNVSIQLL